MRYRVVQWATGAMGKTCLRAIIEHPDLDLVGLYVYNDAKVGLDAGDIARSRATGVQATNSIEDILKLDADVVIHAARIQPPYTHHNEDIRRLLASGKNVISINGHTYPRFWGRSYVESFEDACRQGRSTFLGTGLNPGFIAEKIAVTATVLCSRIDHILITETVDGRLMRNPQYVFQVLGFGADCGAINPNDPGWPPAEILNGMYSEVVALLVARLGLELERVETDHVMLPATEDITMDAGLIKKGTVGHTNWRWHGIVDGKRLVTMSIHWLMETAHLDEPDYHLWTVQIQGLPGMNLAIDLTKPDDYPFKTGAEQLALAASVINSIPAVCAAEPGLMEMPVGNHYKARF